MRERKQRESWRRSRDTRPSMSRAEKVHWRLESSSQPVPGQCVCVAGWMGVAVAVGGKVSVSSSYVYKSECTIIFIMCLYAHIVAQEMTRHDNSCSRDKRKIYTTQLKKVDIHELAVIYRSL